MRKVVISDESWDADEVETRAAETSAAKAKQAEPADETFTRTVQLSYARL